MSDKSVPNLPAKSVNDLTRDVNVRGTVNGIEIVTNPTPTYQNVMVLRNHSVKSQKMDDSKKRKNRQVPPQDVFQNVFGIDGLNLKVEDGNDGHAYYTYIFIYKSDYKSFV